VAIDVLPTPPAVITFNGGPVIAMTAIFSALRFTGNPLPSGFTGDTPVQPDSRARINAVNLSAPSWNSATRHPQRRNWIV